MGEAIYQTRETMIYHVSKQRESWSGDEHRGAWKFDKTPSPVFNISPQSKLTLRKKREIINKFFKIYAVIKL